jgi:hypothetical protein
MPNKVHHDLDTVDIEAPDEAHRPVRGRASVSRKETYGQSHPFDAPSDCFDDFDGRAIQEPPEVKERRMSGQSNARDQLRAFDSRAVFYSSLFLFEWLVFLIWPPLFFAFCFVVVRN